MEIRKFEINGKEVQFVNESRGTRSGFAHDTHFFVNGHLYREATCHYLNRTWERYTYQSVMRHAVYEAREAHEDYLKNVYMLAKGYKKLTAKRAEAFKAYVEADEEIKFYDALLKELA